MTTGVDLLKVINGDAGVNLGGLQRFMAQKFLDVPDRGAVFQHMSGAGMPEGVGGDILFDSGKMGGAFHRCPDPIGVHPVAPAI